jgi:hypothetical protein
LPPLDEYAVNPQHIENGVSVLKQRQRNLMLLTITTTTVFIATIVAVLLQHDLVYSFFGLSSEVKQLHIVPALQDNFAHQPDYFINLLSWFGWFILKLFVSFIGSFFFIRFLKKIQFFAVRFKSFVLKFVGWIISFILLWSGLTYIQYDLRDDDADHLAKMVRYESNIQESRIAKWLNENDVDGSVKDYLLVQTALLHKPVDKATAMVYSQKLIAAEKSDAKFLDYGFKPEQIWTIQHQIYGEAKTPLAKSVQTQVNKAEQFSKIVQFFTYVVMVLSFLFSVFLYLIASRIKARTQRIEQRIF